MKKKLLSIIQYVLYFKALFWALIALMHFLFPLGGTIFPIHSFLFLLNGIVFFCIGFSLSRAPQEVFRAAMVFLITNILLVLFDGFSPLDGFSMVLDGSALAVLCWNQGCFSRSK